MNILSQIQPERLFQKSYLLEVTPEAKGLYQYLAIPFGILLILALIFSLRAKRGEEIFQKLNLKIANLLFFTGLAGLALIFFRFEQIPYLGSRLFLLVLLAVFLAWLGLIIWYKFLILPKEIERDEKQKIFEKYLP